MERKRKGGRWRESCESKAPIISLSGLPFASIAPLEGFSSLSGTLEQVQRIQIPPPKEERSEIERERD